MGDQDVVGNLSGRPRGGGEFDWGDQEVLGNLSGGYWVETGKQAVIELQVIRLYLYLALVGFSSVPKSQQSIQNNFQEKTIISQKLVSMSGHRHNK